jgi:ribose 5-phosphate isomerase B
MGGRVVTFEQAEQILEVFMTTEYEGGRHERRVAQLAEIEQQEGAR